MCAVVDESTGKSLEFRHLIKMDKYRNVWMHSFANKLGRLAQGIRYIKGAYTIEFIPLSSVPKEETVTYSRIVCMFRPQKDEEHRTRLTAGRNLIVCMYDVSTPTASLIANKLLFNSVISTPGAKFHGMDIILLYLNKNLSKPRYMRIKLDIVPKEIVDRYNLLTIARNEHVYIKIKGGMYGLPKAGIMANELLKTCLAAKGYHKAQLTPGLYRHV